MENLLQIATTICLTAHAGQFDKVGNPYYLHPMTVANLVTTDEEKIVALLHDVIEDTAWTLQNLSDNGFPENIVEAIACLTHTPDIPYDEYIAHIKENTLARKVKIADLKHNLDLTRLSIITTKDIARCRKYLDALQTLID